MAGKAIPYRWITGLTPQQQKEIERDFLAVQGQLATSANPFIVVASDGTGNFTSIAAAIASLPAGATNFSHLIYVKTSSSVYDDSALTQIDLTGKNVTVWGQDSQPVGYFNEANPVSPQWKFTYFDTLGGTSGSLRCINMNLASTQPLGAMFRGAGPTGGGGVESEFDHCTMNGLFGTGYFGSTTINDCLVKNPVFTDSLNFQGVLVVHHSELAQGIMGSAKTVTLNGSGAILRIVGSVITQTTSGTISYSLTSAAGVVEIVNNRFKTGGGTITVQQFTNASAVLHFSGNSGTLTGLTVSVNTNPSVTISGNNLQFTTINITGGGVSEAVYIDGTYKAISCSATGAAISAVCDQRGVTGGTALTISGNNNSAVVGIVAGTTTTGVNVSGNNNIITAPNRSACATPLVNTGAGNTIN